MADKWECDKDKTIYTDKSKCVKDCKKSSCNKQPTTFEQYLAPTYQYNAIIKTPGEMGMKSNGGMKVLVEKNIPGLIAYAKLLVSGNGDANRKTKEAGLPLRNQPMGDKIFIKTIGTCTPTNKIGEYINPANGKVLSDQTKSKFKGSEERYVYIDHIPSGYLPGKGNIAEFRGLIPGVIENVADMNPMKILRGISEDASPKCINIQMETVKWNKVTKKHDQSNETRWVSLSDLKELNPCSFTENSKHGKPMTKIELSGNLDKRKHPFNDEWMEDCRMWGNEGFTNLFNMKNKDVKTSRFTTKNKPIAKLFNASFGILLAYILYKILKKEM
tara:strand:- start:246 stop:1235 length:990 start_codon:yes stop_codon:yes gene_type:complete